MQQNIKAIAYRDQTNQLDRTDRGISRSSRSSDPPIPPSPHRTDQRPFANPDDIVISKEGRVRGQESDMDFLKKAPRQQAASRCFAKTEDNDKKTNNKEDNRMSW